MKRIAVFNTAFLGDAILTLPLLENLASAYPDAAIDFYVRGGLAPLFSAQPYLQSVISYDKRGKDKGISGVVALGKEIAKKRYDLWVSAHLSLRSGVLARLSKAPLRIGYREAVLARAWYTHTVSRDFTTLHEIDRLLRLLTPLQCPVQTVWPHLTLPRQSVEVAQERFSHFSGPVLGMHPGSVWPTKCWPERYFAAIAVQAIHDGSHVLLFAGPDEMAKAGEIDRLVREQVNSTQVDALFHNVAGTLSLPDLAAHIGLLSAYLSNDSGPMHLAWPQRVPVVALFGPTDASLGFAPLGEHARILEMDMACRPCGLHGAVRCPQKHHNCMQQLMPQQVWAALQPFLRHM